MKPLLACGLLIAACLTGAAQQQELCTVEGRVVKAGSGEPLSRARVLLQKVNSRDGYSASTNESGRFVIQNVAPGRYRLGAERNGYLRAYYGQRRLNQPASVLTLEPGQRVENIVLNLVPFGVITGRVVDEHDEPVARVRMAALRLGYENGRRELRSGGSVATTDDRGQYRIFGLAPGKYYVSATPSSNFENIAEDSGDEQYVPLYYPGVTDPGQAAPLEVAAGAEINSVDFRLARMPTVRVRGKVVTSDPDVRVDRRIAVFLNPRGTPFTASRNAVIDQEGNFEIRGVAPGSYVLTAFRTDRQSSLFARLPIEVGGSSIDGIQLMLLPSLEVTGRVRFEDGAGKMEGLRVTLGPRSGGIGTRFNMAQVKPDGTFVLPNVPADEYRISVTGLAEDCYLKAVRLGGMDVSGGHVNLTQGGVPGPLEIVLSAAGGRVEGTVLRDDQQPAAGATVVLVPDSERRHRSDLFRSAVADDSGSFVLRGIPPGNYRLLAWEDVEDGAWLDPDFLRGFERSGETLSISERSRHKPQLKVIQAGTSSS
ncbi:MAG TPA: carboxypeptidase-like regulatory domain-containing protein [Bryobacteraceae bacterium]|nr:carboxypeptidase-like regulatory domain-containing protein [Bryobacteraceae bacterium]HOL73917.1 carboxypeptidase-like regulatory domain-containing protein [Bryobacteraceae bacterium]HOQ44677.1 carboxypeptidase-like regulatory domain-containing protein [Bryobacteraceae bacterium]HPQ15824.1 carboxypeptidase-like regulatory domain-containing protein [Bryobacteraceae bacterium]HPU71887.1 carboxypeptidase-like regulatory domain-containing protein [Bryobacteraceae bacterium]